MKEDVLAIGTVARATGLTLRALRFYEARGLVRPMRTAGGRRVYGPGELARLNAAVALKRAGFSLAQIGALLGGRTLDLGRLVALQCSTRRPRNWPRRGRCSPRSSPASIAASRSMSRPCAR